MSTISVYLLSLYNTYIVRAMFICTEEVLSEAVGMVEEERHEGGGSRNSLSSGPVQADEPPVLIGFLSFSLVLPVIHRFY